jgi:hypothetical protein
MPTDFLTALTQHGVTYEIRSNGPIKKDVMTLSDGSKVLLEDGVKVVRSLVLGKGKNLKYVEYGYMITTARRVR